MWVSMSASTTLSATLPPVTFSRVVGEGERERAGGEPAVGSSGVRRDGRGGGGSGAGMAERGDKTSSHLLPLCMLNEDMEEPLEGMLPTVCSGGGWPRVVLALLIGLLAGGGLQLSTPGTDC